MEVLLCYAFGGIPKVDGKISNQSVLELEFETLSHSFFKNNGFTKKKLTFFVS